jgi:hypothetical protein
LPLPVSAIILNEEKDPEEFHSHQPFEPFHPKLSAIILLRTGEVSFFGLER